MDVVAMVKVIWTLYRRAKWGYLEDLGLKRKQVESIFYDFDNRFIISETGMITTKSQVLALARMCPGMIEAAVCLQAAYVTGRYRNGNIL